MAPPEWAVAGAQRLDMEQFGVRFADEWRHMRSRFLKLECWQSYLEEAAKLSQAAFLAGDLDGARHHLVAEATADGWLYDDVRRRGLDYARVRLVQDPRAPYLDYELLSYRIRAELGENIEIVPFDSELRLPDDEHFDFLLFDRHAALIHDYGTGSVGVQSGGWYVRDRGVVGRLEGTALSLRTRAIPLERYLAQV